jgi:hypothetical protein
MATIELLPFIDLMIELIRVVFPTFLPEPETISSREQYILSAIIPSCKNPK